MHPERLYQFLVGLAGEMATYAAGDRRPPAFPVYHHPEPGTAFLPLIKTIRQLLVGLAKIEGKAVPVPLHVHKSGIRTTEDTTPELFKESSFVLAVRAAVPHGAGAQPLPAAVRDRACRGIPGPVHLAAARHRSRGPACGAAPDPVPCRHDLFRARSLERLLAAAARAPAASSSASRATGPSSRSNAGRSGTEPWPGTIRSGCSSGATGRWWSGRSPGVAARHRAEAPRQTAFPEGRALPAFEIPSTVSRNPLLAAAIPILSLAPLLRSPIRRPTRMRCAASSPAELDRYQTAATGGRRRPRKCRAGRVGARRAARRRRAQHAVGRCLGMGPAPGSLRPDWSRDRRRRVLLRGAGATCSASPADTPTCWRSSIAASPWASRAAIASPRPKRRCRQRSQVGRPHAGGACRSAEPDVVASLGGGRGRRPVARHHRAALGDLDRGGGAAARPLHRLSLPPRRLQRAAGAAGGGPAAEPARSPRRRPPERRCRPARAAPSAAIPASWPRSSARVWSRSRRARSAC